MALGKLFLSAMGLMSVASAAPLALNNFQEPTTTITRTSVSTLTHHVATSTSTPKTGTNTGSGNTNGNGLFGVCYAPYRGDHQCKTASQISDDLSRMKGQYSTVRIYGTDCDQVPAVYKSAKANGLKVFLGIWDLSQVQNEAQQIISGINGDWDSVYAVSVGNELVNNGQASAASVVAAIKQARQILRAAGYNGPVVTVDTFIAAEANPEICEASDFCAVNAHAFFDSTISAPEAGKWLANTVASLKAKTSKPVVVTESGWPTQGSSNGLAVPGLSQQKAALDSIKQAFASNPGDVILFSAFNDPWKVKNAATFNAEPYWGIGGATSNSD